MKAILGKKLEMTRIFDKKGKEIPVTLVLAESNTITQIKTQDKDGYSAVQLGAGKKKNISKSINGHLKKSKTKNLRWLKEIKLADEKSSELKIGDKITVDIFKPGDKVAVVGIGKGKGFQGVIKRHGFSRGPETHGSQHHRAPGSIGSMYPQRVWPGKKLPGHMGNGRVTINGLEVVEVLPEKNILMIKGAVPGSRKSLVIIKS